MPARRGGARVRLNPPAVSTPNPPVFRAAGAVLLALTLSGCSEPPAHKADFFVFGTVVEVTLAGADESQASAAFGELQHLFQHLHHAWHPWEPGSLTEINHAFARGRPIEAEPGIIELLRAAQDFEQRTAGRFNAAIGRLVALWGFHTSDFPVHGAPPDPAVIASLVDLRPSALAIEIQGTTLRDRSGHVQLDFSGLAKGLAVDRACALLRQLGIDSALVSAGGDLRGFGNRLGRPWRIGIRNPLGGAIGTIELGGDEAVFTSGNYERFRLDEENARYAHILDPRTGWPAEDVMAATVIASEGMRADAAATALVVAGIANWREVAEPMGIDAVLLTDEVGHIYATPAMQHRLELAEGLKGDLILLD